MMEVLLKASFIFLFGGIQVDERNMRDGRDSPPREKLFWHWHGFFSIVMVEYSVGCPLVRSCC